MVCFWPGRCEFAGRYSIRFITESIGDRIQCFRSFGIGGNRVHHCIAKQKKQKKLYSKNNGINKKQDTESSYSTN